MKAHLVATGAPHLAARMAAGQSAVLSRRQLLAAGVPRWLIRSEVRTGRWQRTGRQSLAVHDGPLDASARRWVAVLEAGPRAALDGVSALQAAGLGQLTDQLVTVLVPKGARRRRVPGVRLRESRRHLADLLRDLARATEGRTTVRIPLVAWRLDESAVLAALEELFRSRGWRRPAA